MLVIELHRTQTPFAVIKSIEVTGVLYSILYQDRYLRCIPMDKRQIRWICDNGYLFKTIFIKDLGEIIEYRNFKRKLSEPLKHNFLIRNNICKGGFI
tara:strand:+ start:8186 stop:8476 length:291 start_codon:yes stop_codon:yes gene_type:complete